MPFFLLHHEFTNLIYLTAFLRELVRLHGHDNKFEESFLQMRSGVPGLDMRVKIPVRSRGFGFRGRRNNPSVPFTLEGPSSDKASTRSRSVPGRMLLKTKDISRPVRTSQEYTASRTSASAPEYEMTRRSEPEHSIQRLVLMSYFPSGFW